jgi:hypothetical protein
MRERSLLWKNLLRAFAMNRHVGVPEVCIEGFSPQELNPYRLCNYLSMAPSISSAMILPCFCWVLPPVSKRSAILTKIWLATQVFT